MKLKLPDMSKGQAEVQALSIEAKQFIRHYFNNALGSLIGALDIADLEGAKKEAWRIVDLLNEIGIGSGSRLKDEEKFK
ncbi:MAG: hypothetical protein OEV42_19460 [Deltaproteobacteria bacterium]|nr:hypothetical protein [Deltaproteobacteria bacterium]